MADLHFAVHRQQVQVAARVGQEEIRRVFLEERLDQGLTIDLDNSPLEST